MVLKPLFYDRAYNRRAVQLDWLEVESCSWAAVGGPERAALVGYGRGRLELPELLDMLRCPVSLLDGGGNAAWWGYLHGFTMWQGRTGLRCTLDNLANRLRVIYTLIDSSSGGAGSRGTTDWANDLFSQSIYGVKEKTISLQAATVLQAESLRALDLADWNYPICVPVIDSQSHAGGEISIDLRGWWGTAGWRNYSQVGGVVEHVKEGKQILYVAWDAHHAKTAQSFTVTAGGWKLENIWLRLGKWRLPPDDFRVEICADSSGHPGTSYGLVNLPAGSVNIPATWTNIPYTPAPAMAAGTYWLVLSRAGAVDTHDCYMVKGDESLSYAGGVLKEWDGSAWVGLTPDADMVFRVCGGMETTAQMALMGGSSFGGQFLAGVRMEVSSGLYGNPLRLGDRTSQAEIVSLLGVGDSAGNRLLCEVTADRYLRVYAQPADSSAVLVVNEAGILCNPWGQPIGLAERAAGEWAKVVGGWSGLGSPYARIKDRFYLEKVAYDRVRGCLVVGG